MTDLALFGFEINHHPVFERLGMVLISAQLSDRYRGLEDQGCDLTPGWVVP